MAAAIAADRNRSAFGFFLATFFFLGPLGVGVALLATRGELDSPTPTVRVIPRASASALKVGDRVRVTERGDEYSGRIGVIEEISDEDDDVYVACPDNPDDTYVFGSDELSRSSPGLLTGRCVDLGFRRPAGLGY